MSATARVPAAVFLNEGAGSARSERVRRAVDLVRRALDADLHVVATRNGSELEAFLRERIDPYATAVIAGGDGSLGIAFNVAAGRDVALGYIPAGFGNATSHLLRLPRGPEDLAAAIATGNARTLDLIRVDGRLALFAGVGWDAVVAGRYAAAGAKGLRGWATAIVGASGELARRYPVRVTVDGTVIHEGPMELLVVGTTPYYGRGMIVNPGARPDAGQFTLRLYPGPAPQLAVEAVRWFLHRARAHPALPESRQGSNRSTTARFRSRRTATCSVRPTAGRSQWSRARSASSAPGAERTRAGRRRRAWPSYELGVSTSVASNGVPPVQKAGALSGTPPVTCTVSPWCATTRPSGATNCGASPVCRVQPTGYMTYQRVPSAAARYAQLEPPPSPTRVPITSVACAGATGRGGGLSSKEGPALDRSVGPASATVGVGDAAEAAPGACARQAQSTNPMHSDAAIARLVVRRGTMSRNARRLAARLAVTIRTASPLLREANRASTCRASKACSTAGGT